MKKILLLTLLFSTPTFAAYKTYDAQNDSKYLDKAISGVCKPEHQRYDDLSFDLKSNITSMSKSDTDKAVATLKETERKRWSCIEKELNKKNITLNLEKLYKENNL
ncbi:hypothetical protein RZO85_16650 [Raoultella ornithinolytica]|uniref:hypothetical protein n=1 Tax=Raoultella TaxID=160674 RepID=UPI0021497156|nr:MULTISPECIES: hypothetical protein [Raoultella]MDV0601335.1 hypothetical protein [Raoultella ornithinolytica]